MKNAPRTIRERVTEFMHLEASGGLVLMFTAILALIANNSLLASGYTGILNTPVAVQFGGFEIAKPFLLWINDGLMAIFFFLVGLEIKREVLDGELSSMDKAALPIFAAIGGIAVPALIYYLLNASDPVTVSGWAIPAATDIAFALGIIALLGNRVPASLKILLLAVAIIDDLAAIIIIALFYTENLSLVALSWAAAGAVGLFALNRMKVMRILPYALIGVFVWAAVLKSGVHATLAGVITALAIPMARPAPDELSPLRRAEHGLHIWVAFLILPLFAFANAGVSLAGLSLADVLAPVPLGIALGLFFGKQIGVFALSFLAVKLKLAKLPEGANWAQVYGVACLTGVGFTMSLFIGTLAFDDSELLNGVRLGVLMGSIASGLLGYFVLRATCKGEADETVVDAAKDLGEEVADAAAG
ncbi:MAG: Na+/H+ antiporter NhaA [Pseudomonadota bacterium]